VPDGKVFPEGRGAVLVILRFSRYRFKEETVEVGLRILGGHAKAVAAAPGCEAAWVARGRHPDTVVILLARFRDDASLRTFEGRLRSDPALGSDAFALMRLTTAPPEMAEYEVQAET